ncbi:reverse transcriptase domain-containing protein [Tanacetum coccineum]
MPPKKTTTPMTDAAIKELIAQGIADALADYEANRSSGNRTDSLNSRNERPVRTTRDNCTIENQVKYTTCTLLGSALTWWNSHVKTVRHDVAYGMPWRTLMKMMTAKYCQRSEIKKLEIELWNLKVKGTDVVSYTQRFQELALICGRMLPEESDQVEKYVGGLPDMIQGNVMSSKPKTMQEAIELPNDLMDQKVRTFVERQAKNKRKLDNNPRDSHDQQPPFKMQNVPRVYTASPGERKGHYMSDCPELKNRNRGNHAGSGEARGRVYALGGGETDQDPNNIEDEIEA